MASREETLLFVVDVSVRGAKALAALDAELAALETARKPRLLALRDAAVQAANGHKDLATAITEANAAPARNVAPVPQVTGNGNASRETALWGARGPRNPGSKVNPLVMAQEAGSVAGMGQMAADSQVAQRSQQSSTSPTPAAAPSAEPDKTWLAAAAEQVAQKVLAPKDDRVVQSIRAAASMREKTGQSPLLTAADAVAAAQREPGLAEAIQSVQAARAPRSRSRETAPVFLSAAQAAGRMGVPRSRIYDLAGSGALAGATKEGGAWQIPEQAVIDMAASGGEGGGIPPRVPTSRGGGGGNSNFWQRLLWGKGLWGLAGMGTVGSLAGFDPMHVVTTGLGVLGSAGTAVAGAGLLGMGALGQAAVGGGSDLAVSRSAYTNAKNAYTAYDNLQNAVATYGKSSTQARQAQQQLNATLAGMPPALAKASMALAKQTTALGSYWQQATTPGQLVADKMFGEILKIAKGYVPLVAQAALQNLTIINRTIQPLFEWIRGPHGIGIFTNLENNFAHSLPTAIHAFSQAMELILRVTSLASNYTGGFITQIDKLFTRLNSHSDQQLNNTIGRLVDDFRIWERFVKMLIVDIADLFRQDAGTGQGIVVTLTQMLDKLHQWETSTHGANQLHNIFEVHKQEILTLLQLIPPLIAGFGSFYLTVAPALTEAFTGILSAAAHLLTAIMSLSPAVRDLAAFALIATKVGFLGTAFRSVAVSLGLMTAKTSETAALTAAIEGNTAALTGQASAAGGAAAAYNDLAAAQTRAAASTGDLLASAAAVEAAMAGEGATAGAATVSTAAGAGARTGLLSRLMPGAMGLALARTATAGGSEVGAGLAAEGLAPFMTGALAGGAGILGGSIVQHVAGLRGGTAGTVGGGVVGGGIGFAVGGPLGAAIGAGIGSTLGPTVEHLLGGLFGPKPGVDYGKRFADGWMKSFEGIVTVRQGQALRQSVAAATNHLNAALQAKTTPGVGNKFGFSPGTVQLPSGQHIAQAQYAYGATVARDFLKGVSSVPYAGTSGLIGAFDKQLSELPAKAGAEGKAAAAETMLKFAERLVQDGRLPKDALAQIIPALEHQFPALTSYLTRWSAGTSAQIAATFKLTEARRTLQQSLTGVRQDFIGASDVIAKQVTEQNLFPNLQRAMQFLKQQISTSTGQAKHEAIAAFHDLQSQSGMYLDRLLGKTQATMLAVKGSAWTNFQSFASAVGAGMHAGAVDATTGAADIAKALNTLLKSLGAPRLPIPDAIQWANWAAGNAPASSYSNAGSGIGHRFAGGFIDQPTIITGEEAPNHPEYVLATNPAYRQRNVDLWLSAGHDLGIPGFAKGGRIPAPHARGAGAITGLVNAGLQHVTSTANAYLAAHTPHLTGGHGGVSASGLSGGLVQIVRQLAGRMGWDGGLIQDWLNVINAESGGSMVATNRSSGAYGIAQMYAGLGYNLAANKAKYYSYGGNPNTMAGQLTAMANYIKDTYGTPAGAWASETTNHGYSKGGKAKAVPFSALFGRQQNRASNVANIDSLLMGAAPGANLHSLGLGHVAVHALGLSRHVIHLLLGNDAGSYGVEVQQLDRQVEGYRDDQHRLISEYKKALKDHNKKLEHRILGELSQVDQAIATTSGNIGQAVANKIQAMQQKLDTRATSIGNAYSILQTVESLPKGTSLRGLGLSPRVLKQLGISGAGGLLGTSGTAAGTDALNAELEKQINAYKRELTYDEKRLPHLHGSSKTSMEQAIQQLASEIVGLKSTMTQNTAAVASNTKATTSNTGAITGSVSFSFNGQNYLASDMPMSAGQV